MFSVIAFVVKHRSEQPLPKLLVSTWGLLILWLCFFAACVAAKETTVLLAADYSTVVHHAAGNSFLMRGEMQAAIEALVIWLIWRRAAGATRGSAGRTEHSAET